MPSRREAQRTILRFVAAGLGLTCLAVAGQDWIVGHLLPLFRLWLDAVDDSYRTLDLSLVPAQAETVLRRVATPAGIHVLGQHVVYPQAHPVQANEAAAGIVLQPSILLLSMLLAWPWRTARELGLRLLFGAVLLPPLLVLDVPMMLYGFAWLEELQAFDPQRFSLLASWADAMNAGGRFVLAIVAAVAATAIALRLGAPQAAAARSQVPAPLPG